MPISLKTKKSVVKPLTITIDGEPLALAYRPGAVTFGWSRALQNIGKPSEKKPDPVLQVAEAVGLDTADYIPPAPDEDRGTDKALIGKILEVVTSWDLEYEPGQPVPLTEDALMDVPTEILTAVLRGVATAGQPGEAEAGQTPATSADFSSKGPA